MPTNSQNMDRPGDVIQMKLNKKKFTKLLTKCPNLKSFKIEHSNFNNEYFEPLANLPLLEELILFDCKNLTDTLLIQILKNCPHLKILCLAGFDLRKNDLKVLSEHCLERRISEYKL